MSEDPLIQRLLREGASATPFVTLGGGSFTMGSHERPDEEPVHEVTVRPFAVALTPVSNREWAQFLEATQHEPPRFGDDERFNQPGCPVVGINWFDAVAYCSWLSEVLGQDCRLPTEAEREYAARGGVPEVLFPWGNEPWSEGAHAFGAAGMDRPQPLGSSPPNGFGLYHAADNVHEWCSDWYLPDGYASADRFDPRGPADGVRRASRGGSWRHRIKVSRIAARSSLGPERRYNDYGMRVYREL
ncbi:MAG: SUMF1/EgtB/PvdO family nonheme iron enzyme [Chloroflexi bacterium]|nr:SUMF1/EgtB/PvdO family nonheme iron enzyme [Chloroflexota bacterium]MDA1001920.1 SUMF1/EgtB/PvdO family nonheme iron enzyme [Chloroflexota bacterium]